jgi:hypothetical protein
MTQQWERDASLRLRNGDASGFADEVAARPQDVRPGEQTGIRHVLPLPAAP